MAKGDITSVTSRPLSAEEQDILKKIEEMETATLDNLEAGARQIITLVTTFYGLLFGVLALGQDTFAATLHLPWVIVLGSLAVAILLLALGTALMVVIPFGYDYREARLDDVKAVYGKMLARKAVWLQTSMVLFGLGLVAFAILIIGMLTARL